MGVSAAGQRVKSIQRGMLTLGTSTGVVNGTISAVDPSKAVLIPMMSSSSATQTDSAMARLTFTNATTVTATRSSATATTTEVPYQVIEYE